MSAVQDPLELELGYQDKNSATWKKLRAHLEARLEMLRQQNDDDLTPERTALLRGRIAEIKNLLAAGESQD